MVAMKKNTEIKIFKSSHDLFQFAAKDFEKRAQDAGNDKEIFSVVLSGGNTPKELFDILTRYKETIPWQKIQFFFSDERYVPANDTKSNYHMAYEHLFSKLSINPKNIYPIPTEFNDPNEAARVYEQTIRDAFHLKNNSTPQFDLVYLGLGDNAHTASLWPFSDVVKRYVENPADHSDQLVAALFVSETNAYRITLTPNALNNGKNIIFLVTGVDKATAVWEVLQGPSDPNQFPAQLIHCQSGKTIWYLDQMAASKINMKDDQ